MSDGPMDAQDQREEMTQAQSGITNSGEGFGTNGNADLGKQQNVTGGNGPAGDVAGSAAGATTGSDMPQEQAGYGSNPQDEQQQGGQSSDGGFDGGQSGQPMDGENRSAIGGMQQPAGQEAPLDDDDEMDSDMGDGARAASGAGAM